MGFVNKNIGRMSRYFGYEQPLPESEDAEFDTENAKAKRNYIENKEEYDGKLFTMGVDEIP